MPPTTSSASTRRFALFCSPKRMSSHISFQRWSGVISNGCSAGIFSRINFTASVDETLKKGDRLSRYRIDGLLGSGGMGAVYRAYDPMLERSLAVKVVKSKDQGEETHGRLLEEARSASALSHPNVCAIYEVGEDGPCTFI